MLRYLDGPLCGAADSIANRQHGAARMVNFLAIFARFGRLFLLCVPGGHIGFVVVLVVSVGSEVTVCEGSARAGFEISLECGGLLLRREGEVGF